LIGGQNKDAGSDIIYKLKNVNVNSKWTKYPEKLFAARRSHIALQIPLNFCPKGTDYA